MALWDAVKRLWLLGGIPDEQRAEELRLWMAQSDAKAEPRLDRIRLQERQQTPPDKETEELERRLEKLDALHAGLPDTIREAKARWKAEGAAEAEARWRAKDEGKGPRQPA